MAHASGVPPTSPADAPGARPKGPARIALEVALWALQLYLAYFMVTVGAIPALTADKGAVGIFEQIGVGLWLMYLTGALEALGALGLLTPWFSGLAALGLMGVMSGAALTHVLLQEGRGASTPAMMLIPLALVVIGRWSTVRSLAARLTGAGRR